MQHFGFRMRLGRLLAAVGVIGALAGAGPAWADMFPSKPITIVSPFPPGGAVDVVARLTGELLSKEVKQPIVVENRVGAGTVIGASYVERSRADGYTLLLATNTTLVTNRFLFKKLPYNPDSLEPIGMIGSVPMVLLTSKKSNFEHLESMVAYAKQRPGKLTVASVGMGTTSHLALENLQRMAGIEVTHVPFNGVAQVLPALMGGEVDAFFDTLSTGMPHVQNGGVNATAITSLHRMSAYPGLPTIAEAGYPGFDMSIWFSLVAPKNTPPQALKVLRNGLKAVASQPEFINRLSKLGVEVADVDPAKLTAQIQRESPLIEELVDKAGIEKR